MIVQHCRWNAEPVEASCSAAVHHPKARMKIRKPVALLDSAFASVRTDHHTDANVPGR